MPLLSARIASATPGAQGFDCDTPLSADQARQLAQSGFRFAIRYLSRSIGWGSLDLTTSEAQAILGAGLALMAVQHVAQPGWAPSEALGASYGDAAGVNAALVVGLPAGMTLWLDLEGTAPATTAPDVIAYVNSWAAAVLAYGFEPGLYVGYDQPLGADELYRLSVARFWRSASNVPDVAQRGYCMAQSLPTTIAGIDLDRNVILVDRMGAVPTWLTAT